MAEELDPVCTGSTGKCVNTNEVGEGEKDVVMVAPLVAFSFVVVVNVIVILSDTVVGKLVGIGSVVVRILFSMDVVVILFVNVL